MTGGSLLVAACLALHSAVHSVTAFYLVWIGLGAALAATLYNPVFAVVTRRYPQDFRRAIITLTFLGGLASTVFIPLSAWLIQALGWRHALWVLAAPAAAGVRAAACRAVARRAAAGPRRAGHARRSRRRSTCAARPSC